MINSNRYKVTIRAASAPSSGGGKYRRPVHVRVLDMAVMKSEWHAVRGRGGKVAEWSNVDSRYDGPRSEYGQALRAAEQMADAMNRADAARISEAIVI
jgi:hypothetical protein